MLYLEPEVSGRGRCIWDTLEAVVCPTDFIVYDFSFENAFSSLHLHFVGYL